MHFSITTNNNYSKSFSQKIQQQGGNAFDMAIGLQMIAFVTEPILTGIGGSGIAMINKSGESPNFIDFFSTMPSLPLLQSNHPKKIKIDFGESTQIFHIDAGSIATPTMLAGLRYIHKKYANLEWSFLLEGAIEVSKSPILMTNNLERILQILSPIVSYHPDFYHIFFDTVGELKSDFSYASTDDLIAIQRSPDTFWLEKSIELQALNSIGCRVTFEDIQNYRVLEIPIHPITIDDISIFLPQFPSFSGLQLSNNLSQSSFRNLYLTEQLQHLFHETTSSYRTNIFLSHHNHLKAVPKSAGNTSHISIVDSDGNAIAMTSSLGESSGLFLPNTRILMNNFLGEDDVTIATAHQYPNSKLFTMCTPTIIKKQDDIIAMGAAGSSRIRSSILQGIFSIKNLLGTSNQISNQDIQNIVEKPRIHYDQVGIHIESEHDLLSNLDSIPLEYTIHPKTNLFFGCLNIAANIQNNMLYGADPRRSAVGYTLA